MPVETFEYRTEAERVAMRRALAFVAEMHDLAQTATAGHVLDSCEQLALGSGRELLTTTLQQAVQCRIDQAEEKKGRLESARAGADGG
jgi:hypothetical protein